MDEQSRINYNLEHLGLGGILSNVLAEMVLTRGYTDFRTGEISSETTMEGLMKFFQSKGVVSVRTTAPVDKAEGTLWMAKVVDLGDMLVLVKNYSTYNWTIGGASSDVAKLDALMAELNAALPPMKSEDPNVVPVNFWSQAPNGAATCRIRRISVPPWDTVSGNYTEKAHSQLDSMMNLFPPIDDRGRLILWHGEPGTGKSYGIRSLAQAWQRWCDVHYIVDPEKFFGDANYMLQVILQGVDGGDEASCSASGETPVCADDQDKEIEYKGPQWNLLIMEDSDEFLTRDAKMRTGQAMSRLLNLTSGFIGQGLNVLLLITTNVELENVHDALQREGRCMANIEFGKLSADEVREWAAARGVVLDAEGESTIADLYALERGHKQLRTGPVKQPMGFGMRS